jgi:hypothetical protein
MTTMIVNGEIVYGAARHNPAAALHARHRRITRQARIRPRGASGQRSRSADAAEYAANRRSPRWRK